MEKGGVEQTYSSNHISVPRLVPLSINEHKIRPLNTSGIHVITGGLGLVGLSIAKSLISAGCKNLILTSRHKIELPDGWDLQVKPKVIKCDVTDIKSLDRVLFTHADDICGIVHAAGIILDEKEVRNQTSSEIAAVLNPKVSGTKNLLELCKCHDVNLEYFILTSSISSIIPTPFVSSYAASNAFLDSVATQMRRERELNITSIRYGAWKSDENNQGMATDEIAAQAARFGYMPIDATFGSQQTVKIIKKIRRYAPNYYFMPL